MSVQPLFAVGYMDITSLIAQAQSGDAKAFGDLYDIFAQRIFRYIFMKVKNREQAEDILQEVFVKSWKALPKFKLENSNFSAWLYRIATNSINDYYRKIYRHPETLEINEEIDIASSGNAHDLTEHNFNQQYVRSVLGRLPTQYRIVLELRFIQEFSVKETAEILKKSKVGVRLLQHRALKKLREQLKENYVLDF